MPDKVFTDEQVNEILQMINGKVGHQRYIGARYVPIIGRRGESSAEWDNSKAYEPLTIVIWKGNSYTSRQTVPAGIDIGNNDFWALTGNYNAQVEQYRSEVNHFNSIVNNNNARVDEAVETVTDLSSRVAANESGIKANAEGVAENAKGVAENAAAVKRIDEHYGTAYDDISIDLNAVQESAAANAADIAEVRADVSAFDLAVKFGEELANAQPIARREYSNTANSFQGNCVLPGGKFIVSFYYGNNTNEGYVNSINTSTGRVTSTQRFTTPSQNWHGNAVNHNGEVGTCHVCVAGDWYNPAIIHFNVNTESGIISNDIATTDPQRYGVPVNSTGGIYAAGYLDRSTLWVTPDTKTVYKIDLAAAEPAAAVLCEFSDFEKRSDELTDGQSLFYSHDLKAFIYAFSHAFSVFGIDGRTISTTNIKDFYNFAMTSEVEEVSYWGGCLYFGAADYTFGNYKSRGLVTYFKSDLVNGEANLAPFTTPDTWVYINLDKSAPDCFDPNKSVGVAEDGITKVYSFRYANDLIAWHLRFGGEQFRTYVYLKSDYKNECVYLFDGMEIEIGTGLGASQFCVAGNVGIYGISEAIAKHADWAGHSLVIARNSTIQANVYDGDLNASILGNDKIFNLAQCVLHTNVEASRITPFCTGQRTVILTDTIAN